MTRFLVLLTTLRWNEPLLQVMRRYGSNPALSQQVLSTYHTTFTVSASTATAASFGTRSRSILPARLID